MERGSILPGSFNPLKSIGLSVFGTEAITAMDISKDTNYTAVAGRKMLKIITVRKDAFSELANLCGKKGKMNLDYSMTDVQWDPIEDQRLATAAGNGTILVWQVNLAKTSQQVNCGKTDYAVHKRTVNRISFHPIERDMLISGSQDGTVRCFDLRKKDQVYTFQGKSQNVSIRDVQFEPFEGKCFAAATETGNIQLWDMRKPDNCYEQFVAHIGPVFSLDWHPGERAWLGSAGRDKLVKVWETQQKPVNIHQIQAIAEVARIKWRPGKKYHIASCALVVDINVSVWDIRRPYIPHAQFTQHKDAVTGIVWHKDPNMLFSCGKDSMIYRNCFNDAYRPADHAAPVALGISSTGNIAFAESDQLKTPKPKQRSIIHLTASLGNMRLQQINKMEEVTPVTSTLYNFDVNCLNNQDHFQTLAKNYRLSGLSFSELCDHNSELCSQLRLHHHAQTWNMIKVLYSCSFSKLGSPSTKVLPSNCSAAGTAAVENAAAGGRSGETSSVNHDDNEGVVQGKAGTTEENEDESSASGGELTENETYLVDKDFVFSEEQDFQFDSQKICADMQNEDFTLANEAFQPRQDIEDRPPSPEPDQDRPETPISAIDSDITSAYNQQVSFVDSTVNNEDHPKGELFPKWDYSGVVVDCLKYYANLGDIQMCVSVLLVLGDKIRDKIDERTQEQWLLSYVDLLSRLQMWTIATEVLNISNLPALTELNQTSTTIRTICSNDGCKKPLPPEQCGWSCEKCKSLTPPCIICHTTVRGLLAWCQGCGHGGHLPHIQEWFAKYRCCPTGCGHRCEYS